MERHSIMEYVKILNCICIGEHDWRRLSMSENYLWSLKQNTNINSYIYHHQSNVTYYQLISAYYIGKIKGQCQDYTWGVVILWHNNGDITNSIRREILRAPTYPIINLSNCHETIYPIIKGHPLACSWNFQHFTIHSNAFVLYFQPNFYACLSLKFIK